MVRIEVRPRISFSPGLQFEDVVAFVPPVYTRYAKRVRAGQRGGLGDRKRGRGANREYLHTRSTWTHALDRADVYVGTWAPTRPSAFLPRTLGVVLPFSSSSPRLTCPISPHWPRECEHVEARFESRGREARGRDVNSKSDCALVYYGIRS